MSFKDLEKTISGWIEAQQADLRKRAEARAHKALKKAFRRAQKERPPMYKPDRPPNYRKIVVLNVRRISEGMHGELLEREYPVDTVSEQIAEFQAKALAKAEGFIWRGTVDIREG